MPFCDVMELFEYWREYPPMHWLLRSYVGYEPPARDMEDQSQAMAALNRTAGRAKKTSRAPEHVRKIIEMMKAEKVG
jgi:hypothetical protein